MEILDMIVENDELIAMAIGAVIGALLIAYTCYVVSKVKHDYEIRDAYNEAKLAGEEYPDWKLAKSSTWYKGYKLGLIECLLLGFFFGAGAGVLGVHLGWVNGAIEIGTLGGISAIVAGLLLDKYLIHPIADGSFMEQVETPLIEKFLGIVTDAPEDDPEDLKQLAQKLRDKGLI